MLRFRTFIIYLIISIGVTCYITAYVMKEFRFESCNMEIEHYKAKVAIIENENRILRAMSHSPQVVQPLASDVKEPIKQTRSIMPVSSPVQTPIVSDINKPSRQNKTITAHTGKVYAKKSLVEKQQTITPRRCIDIGREMLNRGEYRSAIKLYSEVITKNPDDSLCHRWLGDAYLSLGDKNSAVREWREAVRLGDKTIQSYLDYLKVD